MSDAPDTGAEPLLVADFQAAVRRPKPMDGGMVAQFFAGNGQNADAMLVLGRSEYLDATVQLEIADEDGSDMGAFEAEVRRPQPLVSGMIACFFGEDGDAADKIAALALTKFQDQTVRVQVRLVRHADGRAAAKKPKGAYSKAAGLLWSSAFLDREPVWRACGSDDEFLDWIRAQKCCIRAEFGACDGNTVPMHVRRIEYGAGERLKPQYSAIPGCVEHHRIQSDKGESAVGGRDFYEAQRAKFLRGWCWDRIKIALGADSMTEVPPATLRAWAEERGIATLLPINYR